MPNPRCDPPVSIVAHNRSSVDRLHTIEGPIGTIHASVHIQESLEEVPDTSIRYDPTFECQRRPDIVIAVRDTSIDISDEC